MAEWEAYRQFLFVIIPVTHEDPFRIGDHAVFARLPGRFLVHEGEDAQRGYVAHCGHSAQKTIAFDEGDFHPLTGGSDGGHEAGRASADHDHIILPGGLDGPFQLLLRFRGTGVQRAQTGPGCHCQAQSSGKSLLQKNSSANGFHIFWNFFYKYTNKTVSLHEAK